MTIDQYEDDNYCDDEIDSSGSKTPHKKRIIRIVLVAGAALFLKTTLATNISIGNSPNEFGQAVQVLTTCSGSTPLTIPPKSMFVNNSGSQGQFMFTGYQVSNIPSSCNGSQFKFNAFDSVTSTALPIFNASDISSVILNKNGNFFFDSSESGETVTSISNSSYSVDFSTPRALAQNVYRNTLQSQDNSLNGPFMYFDNTKITVGALNWAPGSSAKSGIGGYSLSTAFTATAGSAISSISIMTGSAYSSQGANNPTAYIYSGSSGPTTALGTLQYSSVSGNFVTFSTNTPITVPAKFWLVISTPSGNSTFSINYWSSDGLVWNVPTVTTWRQLPDIFVSQNSSITTLFTSYSGLWAITRISGN